MTELMTANTRCPFCLTISYVTVPVDGYEAWVAGTLIQNALPTLSADNRELLMTGICGDCFPSE